MPMMIIFTVPIDFYPSAVTDEDMKDALGGILGVDSESIEIDYEEVD